MRLVMLVLLGLLLALQYRLWFGKNSLPDYWRVQQEIHHQQQANQKLQQRNDLLFADIRDLRDGEEAIEERARNELGMIKAHETFFRLVPVQSVPVQSVPVQSVPAQSASVKRAVDTAQTNNDL
ncbi:cell division protein FtsB [Idiomarina xiamenensis]|uniref:Cell division protein FtsB n=1 Tax=Idiomarina xiamenensis 10-D-4 TaxID=740709 RepID=K2KQS0_9GAMM|nr:cell division protein FtsB [Idiomarina xiamenensis]EKE84794.1 septum formation initiator, FtsB [Idiomarina xiamenensis 10-D-4]